MFLNADIRRSAPPKRPAAGRLHLAAEKATAASLARRFVLTPRESEVAVALLGGATLRGVAQQLAIGMATARSHLQHLFDKTGTHRQAELILALMRNLDA